MMCNPTSNYPDKIDEMIFFQDSNLENYKILQTYESLISLGKFDEANEFISRQSGIYGYFADFFNLIENRIYTTQDYLQKKEKNNPFISSLEEPTELKDNILWIS